MLCLTLFYQYAVSFCMYRADSCMRITVRKNEINGEKTESSSYMHKKTHRVQAKI